MDSKARGVRAGNNDQADMGQSDQKQVGQQALSGVSRVVIQHLLQPSVLSAERNWQPFREGIDISLIYEEPDQGPSAAFLRYHPGAHVPSHQHLGYEHILILEGEQRDEHGTYEAGTLLIHRQGTQHSVASASGCLALAIWHVPVQFLP